MNHPPRRALLRALMLAGVIAGLAYAALALPVHDWPGAAQGLGLACVLAVVALRPEMLLRPFPLPRSWASTMPATHLAMVVAGGAFMLLGWMLGR